MKECLRCGQNAKMSSIGEALINFVCDVCRRDGSQWNWGDSTMLRDMEYASVDINAEWDKVPLHVHHGPFIDRGIVN
jgi:hypothetical protein